MSRDKAADSIKVSVLSSHLLVEKLAEHQRINATRTNTFDKALAEVSNYIM